MSPTTAHALAVVAFWTMSLCWGLGYVMLRLEHRPRRITENVPSNRSESDHPKAATIVSVTLPGRVRDRDRVAFGHAHDLANLVPLDALIVAREERQSAEEFQAFLRTENAENGRL